MGLSLRDQQRSLLRLFYFRTGDAPCSTLDATLFDFAARHRDRVRLVVQHSIDNSDGFGRAVDNRHATVRLMRDGRLLAEMIGDVPAAELERLAQAAWATEAAALDRRVAAPPVLVPVDDHAHSSAA
jgi:hypothetical protein